MYAVYNTWLDPGFKDTKKVMKGREGAEGEGTPGSYIAL